MSTKLKGAVRWALGLATTLVFAAPLRADHPGHGSHEGLIGGQFHNIFELGVIVLAIGWIACGLRGALRRTD